MLKPRACSVRAPPIPSTNFLIEAIGFIASGKVICDFTVLHAVLIEVGLKKEDRHTVAERTSQVIQPRPDPDLPALDPDRDHCAERLRPFLRPPRIGTGNLRSQSIDLLAQVAGSACQVQEYHRQIEVCGRSRHVAGENAEAAAVGMDFQPQCDFHREIRNPRAVKEWIKRVHDNLITDRLIRCDISSV